MNLAVKYCKNYLELIYRDPMHWPHKIKIGLQLYGKWRNSLMGSNPLSDRIPWITFEARDFLESILTSNAMVFEYGAGGSTLFYSKRVKYLTSIEHNLSWFKEVQSALKREAVSNCDLRHIPPERGVKGNGDYSDPESYGSGAKEFIGYNFHRYVSAIDTFPDEFFDLVAIDGRARPSCILHAQQKVKQRGYLLLDDSERDYYQKAKGIVSDWEKHDFYGPGPYLSFFFQTTIWRKVSPYCSRK